MRTFFLAISFVSFTTFYFQTGPAGVGNTSDNSFWTKADGSVSTKVNGTPVSSLE